MGRWEDDRTIEAKIKELESKYGNVLKFVELLCEHPRFMGLYLLFCGLPKGNDEQQNIGDVK